MFEEEERSQFAPNYNIQSSAPHAEAGALQYQLESGLNVENIRHQLDGEILSVDENGNDKWLQISKPLLNKKGMGILLGYLTNYLGNTKNFALSSLTQDYIEEAVIGIGENLVRELEDHGVDYELSGCNAASLIVDIICSNVHAVLCKGEDANYLKFLRTTQQISEIQHHQQLNQSMNQQRPPEKRGFLATMFGKGR